MTAEIAILNRSALALAADSIVTLTSARGRKTYDSAEKIFELSKYQPIALMIYNNAQFLNVPLDVIIRRFRSTLTVNQISKIVQIRPLFEAFLLSFPHQPIDEHAHFQAMVAKELSDLQSHLANRLAGALLQGKSSKRRTESGEAFLLRKIAERTSAAEQDRLDNFLSDVSLEDFSKAYGEHVEAATRSALQPADLKKNVAEALTAMMFAIVRSRMRSQAYTGFVIAGFGYDEIFPTLESFECDGIYFGKLRILQSQLVDIDRRGQTASVMLFAQKDMPERFIFGIDGEFESGVEKLANTVVSDILAQSPRTFAGQRGERLKEAAAKSFRQGLAQLKRKSEQSLTSIVDHLSKKELAEVAHSLVELTSRKRRYSSEVETVGGPIDVAVLTSNEGFVWVQRKHYFDATLNPRYFSQFAR